MANFDLIFQISVKGFQARGKFAPMITGINASCRDVLDYSIEEMVGKPVQSIFFDEQHYWKFHMSIREHLLDGETAGRINTDLRNRQGDRIGVAVVFAAIHGVEGNLQGIVCVARDVVADSRIEQALQQSEDRFRQMADLSSEWLWEQDASGRYLYNSPGVGCILGYAAEEVTGKFCSDFLTEPSAGEWVAGKQLGNSKSTRFFGLPNQYLHRDGHLISTESSGIPILDANGILVKWRGVDRDVTEKRRVEEEVRSAHIKLAVAQHEMKIARRIQESLLPAGPLTIPGVQVNGYWVPADQIGGDYFDYFCRDSDTVDVVIADVSGHAVGPALFMVETRSALRAQTHMLTEPGETLFRLNSFLYHDLNQSDHFISMFYLRYCSETGRMSYANAGHNSPLLVRGGTRSWQPVDAEGLVLGVKDVVCFEQKEETLEPGDLIFLYTDGVTEAQAPEGGFFGMERLSRIVTANAHLSGEKLISVCVDELKTFRQKKTFDDDLTMVVLKALERKIK
jgi:sigma-B regulation protein RsbU (phosphoserine phosphatase)